MKRLFFSTLTLLSVISGVAQTKINVLANKPGAAIPSTMWGVFFEDINFAADGGLYAELVKNRSFEFPMPMMGWDEIKPKGNNSSVLIINHGNDQTANARYAAVSLNSGAGTYGLSNEGFRGMGIF